jgi:hypothetical protein
MTAITSAIARVEYIIKLATINGRLGQNTTVTKNSQRTLKSPKNKHGAQRLANHEGRFRQIPSRT